MTTAKTRLKKLIRVSKKVSVPTLINNYHKSSRLITAWPTWLVSGSKKSKSARSSVTPKKRDGAKRKLTSMPRQLKSDVNRTGKMQRLSR